VRNVAPEKGPPIDIDIGRKRPDDDAPPTSCGEPPALAEEISGPGEAVSIAELTEKQLEALEALTDGQNVTQVAARIGVNRSTIHRWLQDPHFQAARRQLMQERFDQLRTRSLAMGERALDALDHLLTNPVDDRHRLSAVKIACRVAGLDRPRER
jgi:transposase-like protein